MIEKTRFIPDGKKELKHVLISDYLKPEKLYYPVVTARTTDAEIFVTEGSQVSIGEVLGIRKGAFFEQPIHATVSGKYLGEEKKYDATGKLVRHLVVENDFKEVKHSSIKERTDEEIAKLTQNDYIEIMKNASIVGLGGSSFPTYIKFKTDEKVEVIVANGVECEPYLVSDYRLMLLHTKELLKGLVYAMKAVGAKRGVVALKKKYQEVAQKIKEVIKESFLDCNLEVAEIGNYYPQGWELEVIKNALGISVPQGELTAKYGVLNLNVSTLVSINNAVKLGLPILERLFVFSGNGIKNAIYNVKVGTRLKDLIVHNGDYLPDNDKVVLILGGPMMGTSILNDDIAVSYTTTSLIVQKEETIKESACLRCASCVYSCPAGLQPVQIMNGYQRKDKEMINSLNVNKCIECGLCSYTCPSKIHLTEYMRLAKRLVK